MPYAWSWPSKPIVSDQEQRSSFSHSKTVKVTQMSSIGEVEPGISGSHCNYQKSVETQGIDCDLFHGG